MLTPVSVAVIIGSVASLLTLYSTVPQVLRAVRTSSVEGISWASVLLSLATFTLWVVYAFAVADAIQIVNNSLALVLLGVLAVVVMRAGAPRSTWVPLGVVFASGLASVWLVDVANSFALAMVGTTVSSMRMLPQARLAVSGAPLWGLCPVSMLLAWVGSALWLVYGLLVGDPALVLVSSILLVLQGIVLAYRLPPGRAVRALAAGRLGAPMARVAAPIALRFPEEPGEVELAA